MLFIVTGKIHSGKTTLVRKAICELSKKGWKFSGILSKVVFEKGKREGYNVLDLETDRSFPFLTKTPDFKSKKYKPEKIGDYYLLDGAVEKISNLLLKAKRRNILVIDELGPLEIIRKKGFWKTAAELFGENKRNIIVVVRDRILDEFLRVIKGKKRKIFHIGRKGVLRGVVSCIEERCKTSTS